MQDSKFKSTVGAGLIALFTVLIVASLFSHGLFISYGASLFLPNWFAILIYILQAAAVIFMAFSRCSKASIYSKIGACIYAVLMLLLLCLTFAGNSFLLHAKILEYINLTLSTLGLLLLIWGLSKLWSPIKIVTSIIVIIFMVVNLISVKMYSLYENYAYDEITSLHFINDILSIIGLIALIVTLILTIVWMRKKKKIPSIKNNPIDLI